MTPTGSWVLTKTDQLGGLGWVRFPGGACGERRLRAMAGGVAAVERTYCETLF